ncbi:MAG: RNA polymerase sigma factor [Planctomycetota bacterium]|nr:RNA polymerase sigma factor [Planctomycetota bacterium]
MDAPSGSGGTDPGARLAARAERLRLLVASLAGRAVRVRFELEDLVQEVFLRALADPGRWPADERELDRYLALLARHVVVDAARALRAAKREGEPGAAPRPVSASTGGSTFSGGPRARSPGPGTQAAHREMSADLVAAFLSLAPEHRRVLGLRQFQGLGAAECARRMGRSEVAVHSLYRRALEAWGIALGGPPTP